MIKNENKHRVIINGFSFCCMDCEKTWAKEMYFRGATVQCPHCGATMSGDLAVRRSWLKNEFDDIMRRMW